MPREGSVPQPVEGTQGRGPETVSMRRSAAPGPDVEVVSSLTRGKHPEPGFQTTHYMWRDLCAGPPPRRRRRGAGAHATHHSSEMGEDVRISYTTILRVDPGDDPDSPFDDVIAIDERVSVQRRALHELIDRERAFSDRFAARGRARLSQTLVKERAWANHLRARWAIAAIIVLIRLQAKVGFACIRGARAFLRALVHVPDVLVTKAQTARTHLSNKYGRRVVRNGLSDPHILTNEQKGVVFFVALVTLATTLLLAAALFTFFFARGSAVYTRLVVDGGLSIASILALPIPGELVLIGTAVAMGPVVAFAGSFLGKMIGVWLLFFLGDSLYTTIQKGTATRPRLRKAVDWMGVSANKFGFWLLIPINAIPLIPDVLLYVFAVSGMRYKPYMLGIAIGTAIKFGLILYALQTMGPDRVIELITHPFASSH